MRHPVIKTTGLFLVGLVMVGLVLTVLDAAISGQPFYGVNYKGLPLGTYSTLACLVLAGVFALIAGIMRLLAVARRRSAKT